RTIGRATLTFVDRTGDLAGGVLKLGAKVRISSVEPSTVVLAGKITGVDLDAALTGTTVTATVQDASYGLARGRSVAAFTDQTYQDVLQKIVSAAGLTLKASGLPNVQLTWMLQADSDLGLVDEIAARLGMDWAADDQTIAIWEA